MGTERNVKKKRSDFCRHEQMGFRGSVWGSKFRKGFSRTNFKIEIGVQYGCFLKGPFSEGGKLRLVVVGQPLPCTPPHKTFHPYRAERTSNAEGGDVLVICDDTFLAN